MSQHLLPHNIWHKDLPEIPHHVEATNLIEVYYRASVAYGDGL